MKHYTPFFNTTIMKEIKPEEINDNFIKLIGSEWMLVTAGDKSDFNMMTASWGGAGFLWARPVVTIYVRPERYTHEYIEKTNRFTLTFFPATMRKTLALMGSQSCRTYDKMQEPTLSPIELPSGEIAFDEARLILDCEILYKDAMCADKFINKQPLENWYGEAKGGLHDIYIAEIKQAWIKE